MNENFVCYIINEVNLTYLIKHEALLTYIIQNCLYDDERYNK